MTPEETPDPGGGGEFLPYLLALAAAGLLIFIVGKYTRREARLPAGGFPARERAAAQPLAGAAPAPGLPRRGKRSRGLIVNEPPPPGTSSVVERAERHAAAVPARSAPQAPGAAAGAGTAISPGSPAGGSSALARATPARSGSPQAVRQESAAPEKTGRPGRAAAGGQAAFAGTAGGGGRYGAGAATLPGGAKSEERPAADSRRLATDGSPGAPGALAAAKMLSVNEALDGGSVEAPGDPVTNAVLGQISLESSMVQGLRDRAEQIRAAGRPATRRELREEAAAMMSARGLAEDAVDPEKLVERALSPIAPPAPAAVIEEARVMLENPASRPTEREKEEILEEAEHPPEKRSPPPKGALDAYRQYRETFDWVKQNLGVEPHHVLGILGVETRWGRVTGDHQIVKVLAAFAERGHGWRQRSAVKELAALPELKAQGGLGGRDPSELRGSWAGAMGTWQCMPSSCLAYGRSREGKANDPFEFEDAIVSAANYLKVHGYSQSVAKSIFAYNHSQEYVDKVTSLSSDIEAALKEQP